MMSVLGAHARARQNRSAQCSFFQGARALSYNFPGIEVLYKSVYISKL
jgi:hypothetical protein